jgi:hypothetical protein
VTIEKIEDHVDRGLDRLPSQFKDKPKLAAYLTVLMTPFQPLEDALWQLLTERNIDNAVGVQLDQIGTIVGLGRISADDEVYRRHLRAQILTNKSDATVNDLIRIVRLLLDDDDATVKVAGQNNASVIVRVFGVSISEDLEDIILDFLQRARAGGVRLILESTSADVADALIWGVGNWGEKNWTRASE